MNVLQKFILDRRGTMAVLFGLSLIPVAGGVGIALDYGRAVAAHQAAQNASDATALAMAIAEMKGQTPNFQDMFNANFKNRDNVHGLNVEGAWDPAAKRYSVKVTGTIDTTIAKIFQPTMPLHVVSVAEAYQDTSDLQINGVNISPEAADFNELYAYCYNPNTKMRLGPLDPTKPSGPRLPFAKIADNSDEGVAAPPTNLNVKCGAQENVSIEMRNVRNARTNPAARLLNPTYTYFTDTTIKDDVPQFHIKPDDLVESILCKTKADCTPQSKGGVLPNNHQTDRTPAVNAKACTPGEYLYLGWEDRPPSKGWSDKDYDDIRIVMKCGGSITGPVKVRLVS